MSRNDAARPHPAVEEISRRTADQLYGFFVAARLVVAPLIATFALWILVNDSVPWRRIGMACVAFSVLTVSAIDLLVYRRRGLRGFHTISRNLVMMGLAGSFMVFATGALESPFLVIFVFFGLANALFAPGRLGVVVVIGLQLIVVLFSVLSIYALVPSLVPDVFGGGARTARNDVLLWTTAVIYTAVLLAVLGMGRRLRGQVHALLEEQVDKREEALRLYGENVRALTTLSGEIAHELKNPLASVKGLAGLVANELDGRAAERMVVLRREVDRMQSVLQEFLNFSRPLLPLARSPLSMGELCLDVAELHAGMAETRGLVVEVRAEGDGALVCDERKTKQVLINLVQNALEASPRGGAVLLEVDGRAADRVVTRVADRGAGLPRGLEDRLFEAGVTGRGDGSGLGLPISRLLARQHGGDVVLEPREGGGAVAVLTLPREPVPAGGDS